ncbi:hypothetical protein BsWGS_12400 [Bradybaena similaris]
MGKGGPQPAHQVTPGDLQLEEAVLDLEDPEIVGHLVPVCQLMSSISVPPAEESTCDMLGQEGDEDGDDESKDVDDETVEELDRVYEGISRGMAYNLNNNAKKSRKSLMKHFPDVLQQVDLLLHQITYSHRRSKLRSVDQEQERFTRCDEFMNKTHNNKYLRSIQEEDENNEEQSDAKGDQKNVKNNKADAGAPATELFNEASPKRRPHGGRRQVHGVWRGKVHESPRETVLLQQVTMCGDDECDYKELRKGMGDVVDETSELHNLATISDTAKAELINEDCDFQSPGKASVGPSTLEEIDHTTAADFSSFLDPGSSCFNAENASQTTLIDEVTFSSALSSQEVSEEPAIPQDADDACNISPEIAPPPEPGEGCFKKQLKPDTRGVKLDEQKPFLNNQVDRHFELSCAEGKKSSVSQIILSDEQSGSNVPDGKMNAKTFNPPGLILPSIASSRVYTENIFAKFKKHSSVKITPKSQRTSLVKELEHSKFQEREISPRVLTKCNSDNVTQNHSSSRSLQDSAEPVGIQAMHGQDKCSKHSFTNRRNVCRALTSSMTTAEEINATEQGTDVWANTVVSQRTLKAVETVSHEARNVCEKETIKSGEDQPLLAQIRPCNNKSMTFSVNDNAKFRVHNRDQHDTYSVHDSAEANAVLVHDKSKSGIFSVGDNAKPKVFSIQCQTSQSNLTSASVQCRISESQALTGGNVAATAHLTSVANLDMYRTAADKVLNKLLISKRSQVLAERIRSFPYKSNDIQVSTATVDDPRKRLSSRQTSDISVPLPQIRERNNACFSPNQAQTAAEYENVDTTLSATPGMFDNLSTDVCYHGGSDVSNNLTNEMSNIASLSPAVVTKTQKSPQSQGRDSLFQSSRQNSTKCSKVNANLNSISSYLTPRGQTEDEVTIRISPDSQTVTNSRNTPTLSTTSKIPTTSNINTPQEGNRGVFSYFGNRFYKSSVQNHESSVDGDEYPFKKPGASYFREQASQTHQDEPIFVNPVRKEICHHFHVISNYDDELVEKQVKQANEFTDLRKDMNTFSAPDYLSKRHCVEVPPASISTKRKVVLPIIPEFQKKEKQVDENTLNVMSLNKTDCSFHQPDSFYVQELQKDNSSKVCGDKKSHKHHKKHHEAKKKVLSHRYIQEEWEPGISSDMQRPESNDTSIITGSNIEHHQHAPPLGSENFLDKGTTYRGDTFRDPEIHRHSAKFLDPPGQASAGIRQEKTLESSQKHDETQGYEIQSSPRKPLKSPKDAFSYTLQNKLGDQDSSKIIGSPGYTKAAVSFDSRRHLRSTSLQPFSSEPEFSNRFQRSKTPPSSCPYSDLNAVLEDYMSRYRPPQCPDRGDQSYKADGCPSAVVEKRKPEEPQLPPARVLAESYYDPSTNVINVVVKPVNVNLNHRLRNIKVKIYRSPPRLPPLTRVPKQQKEATSKRMFSSMPLSRNIIDARAENPPFNTTTKPEADERYYRTYGHRRII